MTATAPDLATFHEQFLTLLAKAEAIRNALQPESPPELEELIDEIQRYLAPLEDVLDAEAAREALKEGLVPWEEVRRRLNIK
jgi:hypothetical protein